MDRTPMHPSSSLATHRHPRPVTAVFVFAPYVIRAFGQIPRFADISALMSANAVLLSPDKTAADFIVLPVFAALLLIAAYVRFTFKGKGRF